ncbi:hypothetical protein [Georgenia muralis]
MNSPGEGRFDFSLSDGEASTVMAALRRYLSYWEQHVAEDHGRAHSQEQLEAVRQDVGRLLYRLEGARAPAGARVQYSPEALLPNGTATTEPVDQALGVPGEADRTAIDWQGVDLDGAFALAAEADAGRGALGVLAQAWDGDASLVLVVVPSSPEWAVTHLFFAGRAERRHMSLTYMVSTLEPEVTEVGCAYEHFDRGPQYHYAVIRRRSADAKIRCRLEDGAWKTVTRGQDGWFVAISTAQRPDSAMHLEELVQGNWHPLP